MLRLQSLIKFHTMKHLLSIFILILSIVDTNGQKAITITEFLAKSNQQETVNLQLRKIEYLNTLSYGLPLVEKLEFRTETNDFDWKKQEYILRVSPNSFRNIKTNRQYQQTVQNMTKMELEEALGQALRDRYDLIVSYIYSKKILASRNKQKILLDDKVTMLKRSSSLPDFDVLDLIESEDEVQNNLHDILDLKHQIMTLEKIFQRMNKSDSIVHIDKGNIISVHEVREFLDNQQLSETINHSRLEVLSAKMYKNMLEYEWEAAKSKFSLGFVQAKYGYDPQDPFRKSFSIGIGFDIPLKNSGRLELNELEINIIESESEYSKAKNQLINENYSLNQKLNNAIEKYELVKEHLSGSRAEFALKEYGKIAEASPKALLKLRENTLKNELLLDQLEEEIMYLFIEYLDCSGMINKKPFRNYLSKDLELF